MQQAADPAQILHDDRLVEAEIALQIGLVGGIDMPAASNRMSTILPGTMRSSTKMMTEIPNRVTSIRRGGARYRQTLG